MKKWLAKYFLKKVITKENFVTYLKELILWAVLNVNKSDKAQKVVDIAEAVTEIANKSLKAGEDGEVSIDEVNEILKGVEEQFDFDTDKVLADLVEKIVAKI